MDVQKQRIHMFLYYFSMRKLTFHVVLVLFSVDAELFNRSMMIFSATTQLQTHTHPPNLRLPKTLLKKMRMKNKSPDEPVNEARKKQKHLSEQKK